MENQHYSWQYIKHVKNEARWILRESENYWWKTYDDAYQTCFKKYSNKYTLLYKRKMIRVMELFVSDNILPEGLLHVQKASYYDYLCNEYEVSLRWRPYCTNRTFSTDPDELVQVVGYRVRVWPSRSREGPIHLYYSTCRAVVLPDPAGRAGSMGSFLARLPSRFVGKHR